MQSDPGEILTMRVTVCQLSGDARQREVEWGALCAHAAAQGSDLVLLPEVPFTEPFWVHGSFEQARWSAMVAMHQRGIERLGELRARHVIGTRLVGDGAHRPNEGFLWSAGGGVQALRSKAFLPDEPDGYEATWTTRGPADFPPFSVGEARCALNICTELWYLPSLMTYADQGVDLILTPRATAVATIEKWVALGRVAAATAGAYSVSSNRVDVRGIGGGVGWVIDPDGEVLARTSASHPFATVEIDLSRARAAKRTYPRYVFSAAR
jgi:N-carbamoylputrescine amidase